MLKKEISYTDFNGNERIEAHYFNLTQTELNEINIETGGTLVESLQRMVENRDAIGLAKFFRNLIVYSYGKKSDDGVFFDKGEDHAVGKRFTMTAAYDKLFIELLSDPTGEKPREFLYGIVPEDVAAKAKAEAPLIKVGDEENN
ncbi:MAG: hypothetical protein J6U54_23565 [Clostridiales bacterium]|nr:hypothetical protein [Clostridiales bacterium]